MRYPCVVHSRRIGISAKDTRWSDKVEKVETVSCTGFICLCFFVASVLVQKQKQKEEEEEGEKKSTINCLL